MLNERQGMIFYQSFWQAIKNLPEENQLELYNGILQYSFDFTEPKFEGLSKTIWLLIKPQIEANNKRYFNGSKKQKGSKTEAKPKQETSGEEAKEEQKESKQKVEEKQEGSKTGTKEKDKEKDKENNIISNEIILQKKDELSFENFYFIYPKKINRKKAEQKFSKIKDANLPAVFAGLEKYCKKWQKEKTEKQYIPGPDVWLNNERRTDVIEIFEQDSEKDKVREIISQAILSDSEKEKVKVIWEQRRLDNKPRTTAILMQVIEKIKTKQI